MTYRGKVYATGPSSCVPAPLSSPVRPPTGSAPDQSQLHQHQGELGGSSGRQSPRQHRQVLSGLSGGVRRGPAASRGQGHPRGCVQLRAGGAGEVDGVRGVGQSAHRLWVPGPESGKPPASEPKKTVMLRLTGAPDLLSASSNSPALTPRSGFPD